MKGKERREALMEKWDIGYKALLAGLRGLEYDFAGALAREPIAFAQCRELGVMPDRLGKRWLITNKSELMLSELNDPKWDEDRFRAALKSVPGMKISGNRYDIGGMARATTYSIPLFHLLNGGEEQ